MKVSIVVPVHNQEMNLERCVTSLMLQSHRDIEIILVENGSADRSGLICDEFVKADERITVLHLEKSGVSLARNAGVRLASGSYVMFCDSDDWVEREWVQSLHDRLVLGDFDLVVAGYTAVTSESSAVAFVQRRVLPRGPKARLELRDFYLLERWGILNAVWNKIYVKSVIDAARLEFDELIPTGEDLLFNLQYLRHIATIGLVFESLYNYGVSAGGTLSTTYLEGEWDVATRVRSDFRALLEEVPGGWVTYGLEFWSVYLDILERVVNWHADKGIHMSVAERVRANNRILRSAEAGEILESAGWGSRNGVYVKAMKSRNYAWVWLFRQISAWIRSLRKGLKLMARFLSRIWKPALHS